MDDPPYTTPDEDPFSVEPIFPRTRRRRSSMLDKWIHEQQFHFDEAEDEACSSPPTADTYTYAYLAYPELGQSTLRSCARDDTSTINSYDLVEDEDIPGSVDLEISQALQTPETKRHRRQSKNLPTPTSFRNFSMHFRSSSSPGPSPSAPSGNTSNRRSRLSLFTRSPRTSTGSANVSQHERSSSMSTFSFGPSTPSRPNALPGPVNIPPSKWRPSVLGHFCQPEATSSQPSIIGSGSIHTPSRPSVSSTDTQSSTVVTTLESALPSKLSLLDTLRSRSQASMFKNERGISSSTSVLSQNDGAGGTNYSLSMRIPFAPKSRPILDNFGELQEMDDQLENGAVAPTAYKNRTARPSIVYASTRSTFSKAALSSVASRGNKKKRILVVGGVSVHDSKKFEGLKRWCETFGELRQIKRMPNGDLHVEFCSADVADTVCRLRAKVYIAGVGGVQLSWFTSDKR